MSAPKDGRVWKVAPRRSFLEEDLMVFTTRALVEEHFKNGGFDKRLYHIIEIK